MAFDEAYNEPENVEVLVKSLNPDQPAELYYAHAGDAGADLKTTEEVTLSRSSGRWCLLAWPLRYRLATSPWCTPVRGSPSSAASPCSTPRARLMPATVVKSRFR